MERPHGLWRSFTHDPRQSLEGIFVGDFGKGPGEWTKALVVSHDNLVIVIFVAGWYIRFHDVKAFTVDGIDDLRENLSVKVLEVRLLRQRTIMPNDQMSVAVVHGICSWASGLLKIGVPISSPSVA